jgi:UTP--glucose-1-phosphate uridylyltransferase
VLCARSHVAGQPFAVLLGDDLIDPRDPLLTTMIDVQRRLGGSVLALTEVAPDQRHLYGCAAVEPTGHDGIWRVTDLVEKPAPGRAPGPYALIGRYVLHPAVFEAIDRTPPGHGGEIQLTDALRTLAHRHDPDAALHAVVFTGRRYDTGDRLGYLRAVVRLACEREDLGPQFRSWLTAYLTQTPATPAPGSPGHLAPVPAR